MITPMRTVLLASLVPTGTAMPPLTKTTAVIVAVLCVLSFAAWATAFKKLKALRSAKALGARALEGTDRAPSLEQVGPYLTSTVTNPFQRVYARALSFAATFREEGRTTEFRAADLTALEHLLEREVSEETAFMAAGLGRLSIIVAVGPLLGLLGTVTGVISTFAGMQAAGTTSIAAIAPGISEALICTAAGLVAAIPAAMASHALTTRLSEVEDMLAWFSSELVNRVVEETRA